jgi:hypothetical protein
MSDIVNSNQQNEQIVEEPLTKPKKPRTQKQLEVFQKVQEKRQKNIEEKKKQKLIEGAKLMLEEQQKVKQEVPPTPQSTPKSKPKPKPRQEILSEYTEVDQSDSEEEVVIVQRSKSKQKPKQNPKKKVTRVIIESDSDDSYDSDDESDGFESVKIMRSNINFGDFFC